MAKIIIKRLGGFFGKDCKMICYIDGNEICRIRENEKFVYETQNMLCEFKCRLTLGNPMSEKYNINFNNGSTVMIDTKSGWSKPNVNIEYTNENSNFFSNETISQDNSQNFEPTIKIGNYFYINEKTKKWSIPEGLFLKKVKRVHSYSDIVNYELIEDGNSISKGGVGRALVGGALFGGVGAIVGGVTGHKHKSTCTKLQIRITLNDFNSPVEYITLINSETKKSSLIYSSAYDIAKKIISMLEIICNSSKPVENRIVENVVVGKKDEVEEVLKYKSLLDQGIITKEEFEAKKRKIMGI